MEAETRKEYDARLKLKGLESTHTTMVDGLIRAGHTMAEAQMKVRDTLTPEGVEMITAHGPERVFTARKQISQRQKDHQTASETTWPIPQSVQWAFDNLENDRAKAEGVSKTAWVMYKWAIKSPANKSEFIKSIWSKLMPSQKDLDNQARYSDDGSKQIELAERILARIADDS